MISMEVTGIGHSSMPGPSMSKSCAMSDNIIDITEQTRLKTTMNDLPDEIILRIMSYEFVILGSDMFIFDFPGAAAVCQKWFLIYFEMYWRKWGFLKSKRATIDQWIRLARAKNGIYATPSPRILSPNPSPSPVEVMPVVIITPKSATPPPPIIPRLIEDTKPEPKEAIKPLSALESKLPAIQSLGGEIPRLNTSDVRDSTTKDAWKTVIRRGRKRGSKSTSLVEQVTDDQSKAKRKSSAFPLKILRIIA